MNDYSIIHYDGVKVNYRKFSNALFKVKGLETKED